MFLAHIGCFVPAESATVGMTDRIMTRVLNEDANLAMASTFAQDLCQMSAMLNRATDRSLLIIDEFGKVRAPWRRALVRQSSGCMTHGTLKLLCYV